MKKSILGVLFILGVAHSYSQENDVVIQATNINHYGFSLGIHPDEGGIFFSRKDEYYKNPDSYLLYYSKKIDSVTFNSEKAVELENLNVSFNNGSSSLYKDEMFYTSNSGVDTEYDTTNYVNYTVSKSGENTLQIFISKRGANGVWKFPTYISFSNIEYNFTTPFLAENGTKLFFCSDKPGGFGGYDIYVSEKQEDDSWGEPINLGANINSAENDVYPSFYDGKLYFSSKESGSKNSDILYSFNNNGIWSAKEKLTALNSKQDDFCIRFVDATSGYFCSNRENKTDKTFYFRMPVIEQNNLVAQVGDTENDPATEESTITTKKTVDVEQVEVAVAKKISEPKIVEAKNVIQKVEGIKLNTKLVATNMVYFELNGFRVRSDGRFELDKIAYKLSNNPNLIIQISGYADASGKNEMNQSLSEKRARAVEVYLLSKNITGDRITKVEAYGESNLINDCASYKECEEEAHALNRRVEVKILEEIKIQ